MEKKLLKFNNVLTDRDTAFCCTTDIFTAFYSGLVVFAITGFMAKESGSTVEELSKVSGKHNTIQRINTVHVVDTI